MSRSAKTTPKAPENAERHQVRFHYDGIEFPDYLTGGVAVGVQLWTGPRSDAPLSRLPAMPLAVIDGDAGRELP